MCDTDPAALERMRAEIYPSRYGAWDQAIRLGSPEEFAEEAFDLVIVGTPPESHIPLTLLALERPPRAVLIEKPLSPPSLDGVQRLAARANGLPGTRVFVGYDHVVGEAAVLVETELCRGAVGEVLTIDVEFREHWAGIFAAHSWLSGPADSYLGYWQRGGGAAGEHSHALNLWQRFATVSVSGRVVAVQAMLDYVSLPPASYDRLCLMQLQTERGLIGRVVQDVVTSPARKWARIQGTAGAIELVLGYAPGEDAVIVREPGRDDRIHRVQKSRPDDFIRELQHIETSLATGAPSPLDLVHGIDTMCVVAAAHQSAATGERVAVSGTTPDEHRRAHV